ncbi:hypothetical protein EJB05_33103 [Eragrostis curvula]|uniref:Uncharacterized protein n=1 Tax=Eragrostis curvula TaxID=38414 RepID=A0A5J9U1P9_9POAL|nr:hypothetical protein EJB05_33103 [Eragrostis curvula]
MTAARSAVKSLDMIIYLANNHRAVCSAISVAGFADTQVWFCNDMLPKFKEQSKPEASVCSKKVHN